jgi:polyhydroxyalkanoate synthesis regulator phasin
MRKAAVAGIAALSIAGGSVAVAVAVPVATALAQDAGPTTTAPTTTAPAPGSTAPDAPKPGHPAVAKALDDVLGSLVTDGTITQDQADKIKTRLGDAAAKARAGLDEKRKEIRTEVGAKVEEIASFLGISVDDLKTQLKTKSLGEIAGDKKPALITFLADAANKRIDEAVTAGKLTQAQADKLKSETADRVAKLVDAVGGKGLPGRFGPGGPKHGGR